MIPFIEDDEEGAATGGGESEEMAMDTDNKSDTYRAVLAEHKQLDEVETLSEILKRIHN